ncbi:hypothetical protein TL16_g11613 [Triparma laevis f. inornata]|uniref:Uncharacterized protein n=1 Tax=Triparma laevis f. inornata TaxID=1714386 RepID=A0A9W7BFS7_9STRA|nr:hypothetical protein TL16_g11613 [Triparma laevis f. inornata]
MDKQTKLKQTTTVVQVLIQHLPYPQWFLSFSIVGNFFTMPFQPQLACLTDYDLASNVNGIVIFLVVELLILFLTNLHSVPFLVSARSVGSGSSQKMVTVTGPQRKKALALKKNKEMKV